MAWEMPSFEAFRSSTNAWRASGANITGYSDRQSNVMFLDPDGNELEALWEPSPKNNPASKPPELFLGSITNSKSGLWCESGRGALRAPGPVRCSVRKLTVRSLPGRPPRTS